MVVNRGLQVQEGVRKLITEFDLKAVDYDTKVFRYGHTAIYIYDVNI